MTMLDHISSVCQRCYYQLRQILRVRKLLSAASKLLLVLASVHSRLDYCYSVLHSLPWSRLQLLQSVLNSAARLIRGLGRFDHIAPVLIDLHWLLPSAFLTRSVWLCLNVWKAWPLPIFLISALALQLLWIVLVWDLQLEVISLCRDTGLSGVQGLLLWLVRNVRTNCRLDSGICRLVLRLSLNTWKHTCSELVFLIRHALLSLYYIL